MAILHSLPSDPGATKDRSALLYMEPLLVQNCSIKNPTFCFKLWQELTAVLQVGTFSGCSDWGLQYRDHGIRSLVSSVQIPVLIQNNGFAALIYKVTVYDVFKHRL